MELLNHNNYLLVKDYLAYLLRVKRRSQESVDRYWFWLRHLLLWAMGTPLSNAHSMTLPFGQYIAQSDLNIALESQRKTIETARSFFRWAKLYHEKEFMKLPAYWVADLTPPDTSKERRAKIFVTREEIDTIARLPVDRSNLAQWRDQVAGVGLFMTGARPRAFTTLPIKAVHLDEEYPYIEQSPDLGVATKNSKKANTFLLAIPEYLELLREWDTFIRSQCPPEYPWYAPIDNQWGLQKISTQVPGKNRSLAIIKRFRHLFQEAGLPYKSPHKFRHGYAAYGLSQCRTMNEYHALSRNMLHANISVTDEVYSHIEEKERGKLLAGLSANPTDQPNDGLRTYLDTLSRNDLVKAINLAAELLAR
jgi:integrase